MDWIAELRDYHDFLQWDDYSEPPYDTMSQDEARAMLQEDLEFIIGINGFGELFEREQEYCKLLGLSAEQWR